MDFRSMLLALFFPLVPLLASCRSSLEEPADMGEKIMTITLTSPSFGSDQPIPKRHTEDGEDVSPPLRWSGLPKGCRQLVLICDDPDAPTPQPWVHWVLYAIPTGLSELREGIAKRERLEEPAGALQGKNSWRAGQTIGYRGPAPPPGHGVHHYHFKLYALDSELGVAPGADKQTLLDAMKGHVLVQGELIGTYQR